MTSVSHLLRAAALLLAAIWACAPAHAEPMRPLSTCLARIGPGQSVTAMIERPQAFQCEGRQSGLGPGRLLARMPFSPVHSQATDPLMFRLASIWADGFRVHFRYADGVTVPVDYASREAARHVRTGSILEFAVPARPAALETVFFETRGAANVRGIALNPHIVTRSESNATDRNLTALYAAYFGMVLALFTFSLALWAAMRHRFQLLYCGMVAALSGYAFTSSGVALQVLPWLANNDRLRINYLLAGLSLLFTLQFVRAFFEREVTRPWLRRAVVVVPGIAVAAAAAIIALGPWQIHIFDRIFSVALFAGLGLIVAIMVSALRNRASFAVIFAVAWSLPIGVALARALHGLDLIGYNFWLENGNMIALAVEALISSVMVTLRLKELGKERDHALASEQMARRLAATDSLTGLLNRGAFLELAIGRRARHRLLLVDIDHFKAVNDRLGHAGGDDVLRKVAEAIQAIRPGGSLAVRLGGEEFALLLPKLAIDSCTPEMVLEAVRQCPMPQGIKVTVSLGFADGSVSNEENWKRLYRLADAALYRAKSDGRDRACRATDFRAAA